MSAFIVSPDHIAAIVGTDAFTRNVRWAITETPLELEASALVLLTENTKSVNHRYREADQPDPDGVPFSLIDRYITSPLTPVELLKAITCLEYQSCEHPGWAGSPAETLCRRAKANAIASLEGYDEAPWGIERGDAASRSVVSLYR